jgi:tRNA-dihydrouridine synthase
MLRSRLGWFTKGLPKSSRFRDTIAHLKTIQDMTDAVQAYFEGVQSATLPSVPRAPQ